MAQQEVFYEVLSGAKKLPVYDVDAHNKLATARTDLNNLSGTVTAHTGNDAIHVGEGEKARWNEVSAKLGKTEFNSYSAEVDTELGKKLNKSAFDTYSAGVKEDIDSKLNTADFNSYSAGVKDDIDAKLDATEFSAYTATAFNDYYNKTEVNGKFEATSAWAKETFASASQLNDYWKKTETSSSEEIANALTALDNTLKTWATDQFQPVGNYVSADEFDTYKAQVTQEFEDTSAWANTTFQPEGDYVSAADFNTLVGTVQDISHDLDVAEGAIEDLDREKLDITATSSWDVTEYSGDDTFIKVQGHEISFIGTIPTIPSIVGESGISATYDSSNNQYKVAISGYEDAAFAKFHTSANVCDGTSARIDGYGQDLNLNTNKVALSSDKIYVQPGLYHIDLQATLTVTAVDNQYYATTIKSLVGACVDTKCVDASFLHSETVDLSYDVKIADADTVLDTSIEGFIGTVAINNVNIHEIIQMPSKVNGGGGNYMAGAGIGISNDTISVKIGDGLWVPVSSNNLEVKLGNGLTFTNDGGINALSIDEKTEEVVETVEKLAEDLDTKVTVNMPVASITNVWHDEYWDQIDGGGNDDGLMLCQLFSVPINNKLYVSAADAKMITNIAIYSDHNFGNADVIFGLYEYTFGGNGGTGDTNWVADTGPVKWDAAGRNEFPLIHMNLDRAELKADKMYYAAVCVKKGSRGNLWLAGTTGYASTFNSDPLLTFGFDNIVQDTGGASPANPGFNFASSAGTISGVKRSYNEVCHSNPRFFMQIRNKPVEQV